MGLFVFCIDVDNAANFRPEGTGNRPLTDYSEITNFAGEVGAEVFLKGGRGDVVLDKTDREKPVYMESLIVGFEKSF